MSQLIDDTRPLCTAGTILPNDDDSSDDENVPPCITPSKRTAKEPGAPRAMRYAAFGETCTGSSSHVTTSLFDTDSNSSFYFYPMTQIVPFKDNNQKKLLAVIVHMPSGIHQDLGKKFVPEVNDTGTKLALKYAVPSIWSDTSFVYKVLNNNDTTKNNLACGIKENVNCLRNDLNITGFQSIPGIAVIDLRGAEVEREIKKILPLHDPDNFALCMMIVLKVRVTEKVLAPKIAAIQVVKPSDEEDEDDFDMVDF